MIPLKTNTDGVSRLFSYVKIAVCIKFRAKYLTNVKNKYIL